MTKEKEVREEEETANEDAEELFVEALMYSEFLELHSDAQLLKTMLNAGACYSRLRKDIEVNNDDIPHRLMSFSYKLNFGKNVSDNVSNICVPVDETNMVFKGEMLEMFHHNLLLLLLLF